MMKRFGSLLLLGSTLGALSACSMFYGEEDSLLRDRDKDYRRAEPTPAMTVPDGMRSPKFEPLYPVPEVSASDEFGDPLRLEQYEVPRPNVVSADENAFGVKLQTLDGKRWIYLSAATSQVWPHVQSFLTQNDVAVAVSNARSGLIETDWLQYSDDDSIMARFQISLEKGVHAGSTEIHLTEYQQSMGGDPQAPAQWPKSSIDDAREEWMVRLLAKHLAESISNTSASLLGQNIGGDVKAGFVKNAAEPTLRIRLSKGRSWGSLIHSARQEGFVSWDRSEAKGLIYAGYYEKQHIERSTWKKIITLGIDGKLPLSVEHSLDDIIKHLSGAKDVRKTFADIDGAEFNDALSKVQEGYLIVLTHNGESADIVIRDHRGRRIEPEEAKQLLRVLRKNLI